MKKWLSKNWWVVVIFLVLIVAFVEKPIQASDKPIFIGTPPSGIQAPNLPIGDSAICSFEKDFNVFYTLGNSATTSIQYIFSNDDPNNTVSFSGLSSNSPTVITNSGTSYPTVIYNDASSIVMVDTQGSFGTVVTYRLYKNTGVLLYEDQSDMILGGPEGSLEMGYCQ